MKIPKQPSGKIVASLNRSMQPKRTESCPELEWADFSEVWDELCRTGIRLTVPGERVSGVCTDGVEYVPVTADNRMLLPAALSPYGYEIQLDADDQAQGGLVVFGHPACFERVVLPSGRCAQVAQVNMTFPQWTGIPLQDTYGHKAVLDVAGDPLFAELAILRLLQQDGWDGVWVDTFRRAFRQCLPPNSVELPAPARQLFEDIEIKNHGQRQGCWDVFVWKDNQFAFYESKRKGKDRIRQTQLRWLEAALGIGVPLHSFFIVEWEPVPPPSL